MKLRTVLATATTAAVLSTAGSRIAGAATHRRRLRRPLPRRQRRRRPRTPRSPRSPTGATAAHHRVRACSCARSCIETIGIDRATLRRELRSGQTIAEIATAHNVEPSAVVDALVTAATTKLDAAAARPARSRSERAQKIEAKLPARFTKLVNSWHPRRVPGRRAGGPPVA